MTSAADPSTVGTSTSSAAVAYHFQRKCFHANGRFWVFYFDGSNLVYRTSTDGETWSSAATVGPWAAGVFSLFYDGTYFHYARSGGAGVNLYYRRGTPNADGTVTWSAAEQLVQTLEDSNDVIYYPVIAVDSEGYPFIGYVYYDYSAGTRYPYITKSSANDGTWSTASGFPYLLKDVSSGYWRVIPLRLTGGKMYILYFYSGAGHSYGRLWTGTMGAEETVTSSEIQSSYGAASSHGDDVYFAFNKRVGIGVNDLMFMKRSYDTGWGSEETVKASVKYDTGPTIGLDSNSGDCYVFWENKDTDHVYYRKRNADGTWDDVVDWIDESADGLPTNYYVTSFYESHDGYLGLLYISKTSSPYNVRFGFLSLAPPPPPPVAKRVYGDGLVWIYV